MRKVNEHREAQEVDVAEQAGQEEHRLVLRNRMSLDLVSH